MALAAFAACGGGDEFEGGEFGGEEERIGEVQQPLQSYGQSCGIGAACQAHLQCCGMSGWPPTGTCLCGLAFRKRERSLGPPLGRSVRFFASLLIFTVTARG